MKPVRVLLADDHGLLRAGLRLLLQSMDGFEVVGEAADGREAIGLTQKLHPDVVMRDIMMPELNGLDATARIVTSSPGTNVVIVSMSASEESVLAALRAGAVGYLLKNVPPVELELALRAASRGQSYLCSGVSKYLVDRAVSRSRLAENSWELLTPRQREVLQLVAEGRTSKEIARRLDITVRTAETHRTQLMEALDIHDVAGLVRYAVRKGLISP
ncbi:MAG: response regulator transcription factor [Deltaproteobacteria bacterium]|nr:response regulator transcription factor [Deltaproteobacteria bacterium]